MILIIDASRNRSGGARIHLDNFLNFSDPYKYGYKKVIVYSHRELISNLESKPWLVKINPFWLNSNIFSQFFWQIFILPFICWKSGGFLLTADGSSLNFISPQVRMVRDLLSFEPVGMSSQSSFLGRMRLYIMRKVHVYGCNKAKGVIFQTKYAAKELSLNGVSNKNLVIIPHGIPHSFIGLSDSGTKKNIRDKWNLIYVSPFLPYKNHLTVIEAVDLLVQKKVNLECGFIGGGYDWLEESCRSKIELNKSIADKFNFYGEVDQGELRDIMKSQDIFIFASSCESFGITLLEGMASGIPIACSNASSMPETLGNGGIYFNPTSAKSICDAVLTLVNDERVRDRVSYAAINKAKMFNWTDISSSTWKFISETRKS